MRNTYRKPMERVDADGHILLLRGNAFLIPVPTDNKVILMWFNYTSEAFKKKTSTFSLAYNQEYFGEMGHSRILSFSRFYFLSLYICVCIVKK